MNPPTILLLLFIGLCDARVNIHDHSARTISNLADKMRILAHEVISDECKNIESNCMEGCDGDICKYECRDSYDLCLQGVIPGATSAVARAGENNDGIMAACDRANIACTDVCMDCPICIGACSTSYTSCVENIDQKDTKLKCKSTKEAHKSICRKNEECLRNMLEMYNC